MAVFLKHAHSQQCQRLFFLKGTFKHCPSLWGSQLIGLIHVRVDKHALINFWYGHYLKSKITITKQVERLGECFAETMLYAVTQLRVSYFHTDCNQECFFFFFSLLSAWKMDQMCLWGWMYWGSCSLSHLTTSLDCCSLFFQLVLNAGFVHLCEVVIYFLYTCFSHWITD